jgi:hypothetical protein
VSVTHHHRPPFKPPYSTSDATAAAASRDHTVEQRGVRALHLSQTITHVDNFVSHSAQSTATREDCSHLTPLDAAAWAAELRAAGYPENKVLRIADAIKHGVDIGFRGDRSRGRAAANSRTTEDPRVAALISEVIAADVAAGHKRGPFTSPPFAPFHVSPLSGVPKGEDGQGIRVIHNLSHPFGGASINAGIAREEYRMQSFDDALVGIRSLGRGCLLTKFDVRSAFKLVPVRPQDRALLGLRWQEQYYYEVVLPFGLRTSGYRWEEFAEALHFLLEKRLGIQLAFHYVDDFLLLAPPGTLVLATQQRQQVEDFCRSRLRLPFADEKTTGPATDVVFLGIQIDTDAMECRLTDKRVRKLRSLLQAWGNHTHQFTCEELMSLVGKLEFASLVIRAGTAFLRRIRAVMMNMKDARAGGAAVHRRLNQEALLDVQWWLEVFLQPTGNRRSIWEPEWVVDTDLEIYSDACDTGYGACFGDRWFQSRWTLDQLEFARVHTRISMPYLELYALTHAAVTWGHLWRGKKITFRCDAEAAVVVVQKMRSRRDSMSLLLRLLYATAVRHDFCFKCIHVAGVTNVVADALSRGCSLQELRVLRPQAEALPSVVPMPHQGSPTVWPDPLQEDRAALPL